MHRPELHVVPVRLRKEARAERRRERAEADAAQAEDGTGAPEAEPRELSGALRYAQTAAEWLLSLIIVAASAAAFSESYRALIEWAEGHQVGGFWSVIFPAQVDTFILAGELAVFVAIVRSWSYRSRLLAWIVTAGGLLVSVAWNVGHVTGGDWQSRATAAVPPLSAALALAVGLGILKRVIQGDGAAAVRAQLPPPAAPPAPAAPVLPEEWLSLVAGTVSGVVAEQLDRSLGGLAGSLGRQLAEAVAELGTTLGRQLADLAPKPAAGPRPPRAPKPASLAVKATARPSAKAAVKPAETPLPGDPPAEKVRAAESARSLAAQYPELGRYRAARLVAPGSYALNGHSRKD
jgi:hypothetical protein